MKEKIRDLKKVKKFSVSENLIIFLISADSRFLWSWHELFLAYALFCYCNVTVKCLCK